MDIKINHKVAIINKEALKDHERKFLGAPGTACHLAAAKVTNLPVRSDSIVNLSDDLLFVPFQAVIFFMPRKDN